MLTAEQLRAVLQQQMSYQRVRRLQQRDWAELKRPKFLGSAADSGR